MSNQGPPQPARFKHIADAINDYLATHALTMTAFGKLLGAEAKSSTVNYWVSMKGAPSALYRPQLAQLLGVRESFLLARDHPEFDQAGPVLSKTIADITHERRAVQDLGPAKRAQVLSQQAAPPPAPLLPPPPRAADVFQITGQSDGRIRVKLDVTLPAQQGMALGRYLMDFGLIMGEGDKHN